MQRVKSARWDAICTIKTGEPVAARFGAGFSQFLTYVEYNRFLSENDKHHRRSFLYFTVVGDGTNKLTAD